jgi:hypothetical protein
MLMTFWMQTIKITLSRLIILRATRSKQGWKEERLIYRHFFNERQQKWLFYKCFEAQRALGLARSVPDDLQVQIGSQWWCLRRRTVEWVLDFTRERRDVMRFFQNDMDTGRDIFPNHRAPCGPRPRD